MRRILSVLAFAVAAGTAGTALAGGTSLGLLYPFNSAAGAHGDWTLSMAANDDGSSGLIPLGFDYCFYNTTRTSLYINNNGNLTFGAPYGVFSPVGFPIAGPAMVAPFWSDVDTRNRALGGIETNFVWHKFLDENLDTVNDLLVVTWDEVGYYNQHNNLRATFQVAISSNLNRWGAGLNTAYSYGDMAWTTGDASGGVGGFPGPGGGSPANVGANFGDGAQATRFGLFDHPGVDYDGGGGLNDGVDYLDNIDIFFNACLPEPGSLSLLAIGGLALISRRRS